MTIFVQNSHRRFCIMKRKIYIITTPEETLCYSNLSKLIRDNPNIHYFSAYRSIKETGSYAKDSIRIVKTTLK